MSHWAELDDNNVVIRVLVCDNNDPNGDEGYQWLIETFGGRWIKTSYNNRIRFRYAMVGGTYDEQRDAFIPLKEFPSWVLDEVNLVWVPPFPCPEDGKEYDWDEETTSWKELPNQ